MTLQELCNKHGWLTEDQTIPAELAWNEASQEIIEACADLAWERRGCFCSDAACRDFIDRLRSNV